MEPIVSNLQRWFNFNARTTDKEYQKLISPNYCSTFQTCEIDEQSFYYGIKQGFAGYSGPYTKFAKTNIAVWPKQDSKIVKSHFKIPP